MRMARITVCSYLPKDEHPTSYDLFSVPINFDINTEQTGRGNHVMLRGKKYMLDMPLDEALEELNAAMMEDRSKQAECDHWWHQLEDGLAICEKCKKIQ